MSKIINLRQARKARERAEKARKGDENAAKHGVSREEREFLDALREKAQRDHEGHKRDE
ncbi:DUF4169 family protein [Paracoccaceae bacterium GXU_MW_L88]